MLQEAQILHFSSELHRQEGQEEFGASSTLSAKLIYGEKGQHDNEGVRICYSKMFLFDIRIILGQLFLRNSIHRKSSEKWVESTLL